MTLNGLLSITQMQDGQIDYSEFVAMMRRGNGGVGMTIMKGNMTNLGDALVAGTQ
jgi:ribosomal protein S3